MKKGVTVTNIMADGSICEDLSKYEGPLPKEAERFILKFIQDGRKQALLKQNKSGTEFLQCGARQNGTNNT